MHFTKSYRDNSLSFVYLHREKLASAGDTARKLYTKLCGKLFSLGFRINSTVKEFKLIK